MRRALLLSAFSLLMLVSGPGSTQPPRDGPRGPGGPPRFELGRVFPPELREELKLTKEQQAALEAMEKEVKEKLNKLLTAEQKKAAADYRPGGPPGDGPGGQRRPPAEANRERPAQLKVDLKEPPAGLVKNPRFTEAGRDPKTPAHYTLTGDAAWVTCGNTGEFADRGIALYSGKDLNGDGMRSGSVTQVVTGFPGGAGKWYRFTFRGLAEPGFAVEKDALSMRVDYFSKKGTNPLDGVTRNIYPLIERDRKELAENGKNRKNGGAVWKTYVLEFRLPFAEIDTLNLSVGFKNGSAKSEKESEFYVTEFSLKPIPPPEDAPKVVKTDKGYAPSLKSLIPLGGRWYYDPEPGMKERPGNADRDREECGSALLHGRQAHQPVRREHDRLAAQGTPRYQR